MLDGKESPPELVRALNTYLVLLADHGMNASTFTARVIASTDSDLPWNNPQPWEGSPMIPGMPPQ